MKEINTIVRAVKILECLSAGTNRITEISKSIDTDKASVHRILKTLENRGMAIQNPVNRQYYIGPLVQRLAANSNEAHHFLIQSSLSEMEFLRTVTDETAVLQVRQGIQRIVMAKVESKHPIRYNLEKGQSAPLFAGAGGKVLSSLLPNRELINLLDRVSKLATKDFRMPDKTKFIKDIEKIREEGFAVTRGELVKGAVAVAVPIMGYSDPAVLEIVGPENRIDGNIPYILEKLSESVSAISEKLMRT